MFKNYLIVISISYIFIMINKAITIRILTLSKSQIFTFVNSLINSPPSKYIDVRSLLKENGWRDVDLTGKVNTIIMIRSLIKLI